jgi:hypothetical protein
VDLPVVNVRDRASIVRRLDALYMRLGRVALHCQLPANLARAQQAALQSASQVAADRERLTQATAKLQRAVSQTEKIQATAEVARLRNELNVLSKQDDFAHLVLGRDCANADCRIPGMEQHLEEIQELRRLSQG